MINTRGKSPAALATMITTVIMSAALLSGCSNDHPSPGPSTASAQSSAASTPTTDPTGATSSSSPAQSETTSPAPEPTTTNTLPPPPVPTSPAPRTSGKLTAKDLPVPKGWRTVARKGGGEQDYVGNGSWTHARDPRYAAQDVITVGCAPITRDDYTDPIAALEGTYGRKGAINADPGIGELLQFKNTADATNYYQHYLDQVRACDNPNGETYIKIISSDHGLIDQRVYDGTDDWTEIGKLTGSRLTLIILTDPGHKITKTAAEAVLAKIKG